MDEKNLVEKTGSARNIVIEAVAERDGAFAVYLCDHAGLVLLHLLKMAGGGRVPVPVISLQFQPIAGEVLRFVDKVRRIYSLDMTVERFPAKPDDASYTEDEIKCLAAHALKKGGVRWVLSSCTEPFKDGSHSSEMDGYREFRPLSGFSGGDVSGYIARHGLPVCSIDIDDAGLMRTVTTGGRPEDPDDKELMDKLKSLGYM